MSDLETILYDKDTQKKPKRFVNIWGIISGIIVFVSVFAPYVSLTILDEKINVGLMEESIKPLGIIIRAIAVLGILFSALGINFPNIIAGLLTLAVWTINYAGIVKFINKTKEVGGEAGIHFEKGLYLLLAGSICFILAGIVGIIQRKKRKNLETQI